MDSGYNLARSNHRVNLYSIFNVTPMNWKEQFDEKWDILIWKCRKDERLPSKQEIEDFEQFISTEIIEKLGKTMESEREQVEKMDVSKQFIEGYYAAVRDLKITINEL